MNKLLYLNIIIFLVSAFLFISCKDTVTGDQIDNIVIPSSNISYQKYIQPVFNVKCINCHGNGAVDGGVNLTTWSYTTADPSVVFPGNPDNSSLVWCVQGRAGVSPMPPLDSPYKPLTANQVSGVITWIKEGAKNN
ncbi:MAG: hypothetical protein M1480_13965 [Bacteroidetes bacterium]|nr:hypothetical protein [Bacteroidota bacterium]